MNDEHWERRRAALDEAGRDEWYARLKADHDNDHEQGLDQIWGGKGKRCQWCEDEEQNEY